MGCQDWSTGLRSGRTDLLAHDSRDLKTSDFSGGRVWVISGLRRGAETAEGGGRRRIFMVVRRLEGWTGGKHASRVWW